MGIRLFLLEIVFVYVRIKSHLILSTEGELPILVNTASITTNI